ncbi:MAG: hypothetical protein F4X51_11385 [Gemmatimonadetes bacterium]|nr:hypothetical protein [Gemmatimonadota bacterium]
MIEQNHLELLLDLNTDENPHSGGDLLDHLRGTHDFLQAWGNDQAVCLGGLFHSIYGTQSYKTESASLEDRQRIREVIGERAERLAFLFSVSIRSGFFEGIGKEGTTVWNRVHEEHIPITQADLRDLIEMEVANYLEFMPRSHFTVEELDTFEAKVERGKPFLSPLAYEAIKAGIRSKRLAIAS